MDSKYLPETVAGDRAAQLVYVRAVRVADLPPEVQDQAGSRDVLYEVSRPSGEQLALVGDREMAFDLARKNDLDPVTLH
ncbi:DUF1150 family protein [Thalassobius sp. Cn5-15]|uniref:DUF1150 family protein n=1 Tax=Thalassobius sp. Cn5-15 TaxID=2917763 RepID=UPI001EF1BBD5|nr:DUF1150 family protein [Thalassobius sp. Cn5-15]MCG7493757.1 DUF1150 domain-containing protein [Thalassobius sp. Cn5-15]